MINANDTLAGAFCFTINGGQNVVLNIVQPGLPDARQGIRIYVKFSASENKKYTLE